MVVISQKNGVALETDKFIKFTSGGGRILAVHENNSKEQLGIYGDSASEQYALEMFAMALADGERLFRFPKEADVKRLMEIERSGQSGISVKTKANRHGGS